MRTRCVSSLFFIAVLLFSCKEDKDETPPTVSFISPFENQNFDVQDDVRISATVNDNEKLESIRLSLVRADNNQTVLNTQTFIPSQRNFNLETFYNLSDSLLEGGSYYFKIEADDGENTFSEFRFIAINGLPRKKLGVYVFGNQNGNTSIYADQNDFQFSSFLSFSQNFQSGLINSSDQQLWFLPSNDKELEVYQLKKNELVFSESLVGSSNQLYNQIILNERSVYISTKNGEIQGYNNLFADNFTYQAASGREVDQLAISEKYLLAEEANLSGANRTIGVLFKNSAALSVSFQIVHKVVAMYFTEQERGILFQNDKDGGRISELNIDGTTKRKIISIADSVLSVEQVNADEYLIATSSKIMRYELDRNNLVDYLFIPNAKIEWDDLNQQLYVANTNELSVYDSRALSPTLTTTLPFDIEEILIRYNYD